jgi:hypothetical protein
MSLFQKTKPIKSIFYLYSELNKPNADSTLRTHDDASQEHSDEELEERKAIVEAIFT